jgi:tetratricopeptide (TPR) repeat protein
VPRIRSSSGQARAAPPWPAVKTSFTTISYRGRRATCKASEHSFLPPPNQRPANSPADNDRLRALGDEAFAHHRAGQYLDAIACYQRILSLKPDLAETYNNFGQALLALNKPDAAILAFECGVELKPENPEALCNWGLALANLGQFDDAEAKYRQALAANPRFAGAYNNLGLLMKAKGRLREAQLAFELAIGLAPRTLPYYENLAAVRTFAAGDRHFTALEALAGDEASLTAADRIHLHFTLAKAYEHIDQPDTAFRHLLEGNALKRQGIVYDEAGALGQIERLCTLIDRDFITAHQGGGTASALPVFIVGMTRSGTTLIEQLLASHPQVFGAGELDVLDRAVGAVRGALPGCPTFPEMMRAMSAEHFQRLGEFYLDTIARRAPAATRITDKMTVNFVFAGLIHLALPNATIIHVVRDPLETCVSCFATHFSAGHAHAYDLAELGRYYRHYQAVMRHWHSVLPSGRIMDVRYEELVADLEGVARRIVAHCGLAWDARCLDFHRTDRPVLTASAAQVRRPIYTGSIARARKYQAFLGPLRAALAADPGTSPAAGAKA